MKNLSKSTLLDSTHSEPYHGIYVPEMERENYYDVVRAQKGVVASFLFNFSYVPKFVVES